ncbi:MAG: hypothetical protein KM312_08565 [Hydrogenibacillus schlegelii]|uniref:Uncharacterized protein n=1 Tax=Hydrogenibacillus schlegelii TaxID=1484 RepID=A0A947G869_HYDSH|nr:hypothetical protein [Hydrogenibacillus schlegelii]MBT9282679.1 hypothetical protein [Hydrogenibacillus schlegelii]
MKWLKWTEAQLRRLAVAPLIREDMLLELRALGEGEDGLRSPWPDGMPRRPGFEYSTTESAAIYRKEAAARLVKRLKAHEAEIERIRAALASLKPVERDMLEMCYLRADLVYESNIARLFGLSLDAFMRRKVHALAKLFERLTGSWPPPVDIEALIAGEAAKEAAEREAVWEEWTAFMGGIGERTG